MEHLISAGSEMVLRRLTGPAAVAAGLLLLSILVSAIVVFVRSDVPKSVRGAVCFMFPKDILTHKSARADFAYYITHKFVMLPLSLPAGAWVTAAVGYATHSVLQWMFGTSGHGDAQPGALTLIAFTASMLLAYDLSYYLYHRTQHRLPILWELHKVHHSAEVMVGTTKDRVHPLDEIMNRMWDGMITGPVYGIWLFFAFDPVELTVLGVNVYVLRNIIMMDFVRHTHLKISFGRILNQIILCPHYHQLHHSIDPKHYDRNFGLMMPVWDRLFGTLAIPEPNESFAFGLSDREHDEYQSLPGLYILPLRKMARMLRGRRARSQSMASARQPGEHREMA